MPFDQLGRLVRNQSTSTGVAGAGTGLTRSGSPSGRQARGATPADTTDYSGAATGSWGAGVGTPTSHAGQTPANPYDPATAASATAASGAAARDAAGAGAPPPAKAGSESGNTYLEDRYLARLYGQDPAFNYAAKRGGDALDTRMSAGGSYNSGARGQQQSDMYANLLAQSQGQLDALAAGATGARQNKINSMFGTGLGLAGGEAGTGGAYDLKGADSANAMNQAILMMMLNKAGVDSKSNSAGFANLGALGSLFG